MRVSDGDVRELLEPVRRAIRPMPPHEVMMALLSLIGDEPPEAIIGAREPFPPATPPGESAGEIVVPDTARGTAWQVAALTATGLICVRAESTITEWTVDNNHPAPHDRIRVTAEVYRLGDIAALGIRDIEDVRDDFGGWKWTGIWSVTLHNGEQIQLPNYADTDAFASELRRRLLQPSG